MTTETLTHEDCLDHRRGDCQGEVEFRMPLSPSGRAFPRCDKHWSARLDEEERINDRVGNWRSDVAPDWFDPTLAGERWEED